MWIRGSRNRKLRSPGHADKAHGRGLNQSDAYWVERIQAAVGDDLLRLNFSSAYAAGLFKPQIAATLALTAKGEEVAEGQRKWSVHISPALTEEASESVSPKEASSIGRKPSDAHCGRHAVDIN